MISKAFHATLTSNVVPIALMIFLWVDEVLGDPQSHTSLLERLEGVADGLGDVSEGSRRPFPGRGDRIGWLRESCCRVASLALAPEGPSVLGWY